VHQPNAKSNTSAPVQSDEDLKAELRQLRQWKLRTEGAMQSATQILREWDTVADESVYSGAMERILGIFPHEIAGQFEIWMLLIHPDDRMAYRREIERVLAEGGPFQAEYRARKKSGHYTVLLEQGYFIAASEAGSTALCSVISDVTELREMEARLSRSQRAEAFSKLTGGVAHDFNNMLSVVIGYAQILTDEMPEKSELTEFVREIEKAALRASSLTNQLLAFSKPPAIRRGSINVGELLNDVVKMLNRLLGEQIELLIELEKGLPAVQADRSQVEQVFINLAVAAREAMSQGGQLKIQAAKENIHEARMVGQKSLPPGSYACVSLTFTPRSGRSVSKTLEKNRNIATAASVIEENEGLLEIPSLPASAQSRLDIFLPGVRESQPRIGTQTTERAASPATILLVEDDSAIRNFARTVLQRLGHQVIEADDGATALSYFEDSEKFAPDLVFTDMVMPRMGGLQLARKIEKKRLGTVFLLTSGYPDQQELAKENESDFAFLRKPFSVGDLISKVGSLLEGRGSQQ
jgi:PAS domain S-box-containing protein